MSLISLLQLVKLQPIHNDSEQGLILTGISGEKYEQVLEALVDY
ncbi:hypothetical protein cce_3610 [Crocosphaera subtropica ATCC 51142]|uniref:Uncharacterized protein n=1 Tax=Crocosphaera subtropica (strain ATCC 51142 / BH68) TaxID=43989 RepID=B1X0R9_CROS5|nr:hypothetical protein cce_3610 [Crocosphaera subtropica ATCC 51142]